MDQKVIIIGAGFAGLAASHKLLENNIPHVVLEGRQRIGGRVLTDYSMGIPISLGPQWLHGLENNPIRKIADSLSLNYISSNLVDSLFFDSHQKNISPEFAKQFFEDFNEILASAKKYALQQTHDIALQTALKAIHNKNSNGNQNWNDLYQLAKCFLSLYTGASINDLSTIYWDQEKILPGGNHLLLDGFTPIINLLAKGSHIHFDTVVFKIIRHKSHITVLTSKGEFSAKKLIITVPLGVLKRGDIIFEPHLPDNKLSAIKKLDMGLLNAIVLKFPRVFWPSDSPGMFFSEPSLNFRSFVNLNFCQQQPILTGRIAGDEAKQLETSEDRLWVEKAMNGLTQIFGKSIPQPQNYLITRWMQDPFSYGSYSYIPVGATGEEHDQLADPIDNQLLFAGEATHREYPATVHGAYLSGIREAERILGSVDN